jgi:hypothetical protein
MSEAPKIVPLRGQFESIRAFLGSLLEDVECVGIVGMVKLRDGRMEPVACGVTVAEMSLAGAVLLRESSEEGA